MRTLSLSIVLALLGSPLFAQSPPTDPTKAEVPLSARNGWKASLIIDNDVGIWTVRAVPLIAKYGCPEVIGLDDKGRCIVLVSYSGKWTPFQTVQDNAWLGALAHVDLDPGRAGPELYTGGQNGNLYEIWPHPTGGFDALLIGHFAGLELHTLVAGDLDPAREGNEMLAFTRSGEVFDIRNRGDGRFDCPQVATLPGRVRDAVVLGTREGEASRVFVAMRAGRASILRFKGGKVHTRDVLEEPMGFGRVARRANDGTKPEVLYATRDDGVVLRLEESKDGSFARQVIFAGPQGTRGVASGRFHEDPEIETVAVFGYSQKVQLLSRRPGAPWTVETIFEDRDRGHWLTVAEVDGRNSTDELIGSGYGSRIFLLSRPPGYGLKGVPADDATKPTHAASRPRRLAVAANPDAKGPLSSLSYQGGFETKTLLYETLVRRNAKGAIIPALAASWKVSGDGLSVDLRLRAGARFHDESPVTAEAVRLHFRRWVGLPEHDWLGASRRIVSVTAPAPDTVRITMDRPYALLPDLCVVNPCAIQGPRCHDAEGRFSHPVGSAPWRLEEAPPQDGILRYRAVEGGAPLELLCVGTDMSRAVAALESGQVDGIIDGWLTKIPRDRVQALRKDARFRIEEGPGSAVVMLAFSARGPTADQELRARVALALDRAALIDELELGHADPCLGFAAPSVSIWPTQERSPRIPMEGARALPSDPSPVASTLPHVALRLIVAKGTRDHALASAIVQQLQRHSVPVSVVPLEHPALTKSLTEGSFDLRLEWTWGVPYDPFVTLGARFLPPPEKPSAASRCFFNIDPRLTELTAEASNTFDPQARTQIYGRIQELIQEKTLIVPLYAPRRLAVLQRGMPPISLDHDLYRLPLTAAWQH